MVPHHPISLGAMATDRDEAGRAWLATVGPFAGVVCDLGVNIATTEGRWSFDDSGEREARHEQEEKVLKHGN